ncbi:MAG TPA: pilus assembly protein TadG-related protein [Candidatus Binataceae bacterium]|nr:pilus assembly protein TadG-related protein [Candidatus Binataceae bacterium]
MQSSGQNPGSVAGRQSGQVLILIVVALVVLMGAIALSADIGYLQYQRNIMQTAADSAAIAAAQELPYGDYVSAGQANSAKNGFTNNQNSVTVAVNNPPTTGPDKGNSGYVEAIITQPQGTYFLRVLGVTSATVYARAVATQGNGPNCIYIMDPSASAALSASGNISIQSACGVIVDSSSSSGLSANGNVTMTAPIIGVVGNYSATGNCTFSPTPSTGIIPAADPLAYVQAPSYSGCNHTNFSLSGNTGSSGSPYQVYAGVYCGGITTGGNTYLNFNPGTYIIAGGGMNFGGNTWMTGTGVTFYNTSGTGGYGAINIGGNVTATLSAPTSGSMAGILFFQDRGVSGSAAASTITGNSSSTFNGAIYFPTTQLSYAGNSATNGYTILVVDKLVLVGNATVGNNYSSLTNGSPIKAPTLTE